MPVQNFSNEFQLPWLLRQMQGGQRPPPSPAMLPGMQAIPGFGQGYQDGATGVLPQNGIPAGPQQGQMAAPLLRQASGGLAAGMGFDRMRQLMPGPWGQQAMPQIPRYQPGDQLPDWARSQKGLPSIQPGTTMGQLQPGARMQQLPLGGLQMRPGAPAPQAPPPPGLSRPLGDPGAPRPTMMGKIPGGAPVWQQRGRIASAFGQPSGSQINREIPRKQATSYASGMAGERMGRKKQHRQARLARRAGGVQ